jgi:hypothetical protein
MMILNKLEEWAFFDLPADDPLSAAVEETRLAFTHALVTQKMGGGPHGEWYTVEADRDARLALAVGIAAGDLLAKRQAAKQHGRRLSGELAKAAAMVPPDNAITDHEARMSREAWLGSPGVLLPETPRVGVAVSPVAQTPALEAAVAQNADFVTIPMRWVEMEPSEGKYAFARTDKWIEWAVRTAKLPVVAGPLIDLRPGCVPDFLYIWEHDYETLRDVVVEHCKNLVTRYRRTIDTWVVASGLPCLTAFKLSYEQVLDLTRTCVLLVRKLAPAAKVNVEVAQPWGEYTSNQARSIPPALYAELLNQLGLNLDALGVRVQMGQNLPGRSTRDLMALSHLLDRLAAFDRPLAVTAMGAPSRPPVPGPPLRDDEPPPDPGVWQGPWSPESQARWLSAVGSVIAGKPFVQSLCWQELVDIDTPGGVAAAGAEMPGGGLMTGAGQPKPALRALGELRAALRDRRGLPGLA